jgi:eukaryotic-like serine/threonine-protein kinase
VSEESEEIEEIEIVEEVIEPMVVGPYALFGEVASGGMASVHLGRLLAPNGLGRTVAIKRMHREYTRDPDFCAMFMDEARFVGRLRHRNVVRMVDVVRSAEGLFLVMEYIHGESLSRLMRLAREAQERIPPRIAATILHGVLLGLHSAHELADADGKLLGVVHRDVSPQNIIVGADGIPRVLDFGVAKATGRMQTTREGQLKGKLAYMAPEQISGRVDRRTDIFAAGVVLWEAIAGRRMHEGAKDVEIVQRIVSGKYAKPSDFSPDCPAALDKIVLQALAPDPMKRFATAQRMADEIRRDVGLVARSEVAAFVKNWASEVLEERAEQVVAMERASADLVPAPFAEATTVPAAPTSSNRDVAAIARELDEVIPSIVPPSLPLDAVEAPVSVRTAIQSSPGAHRASRPSLPDASPHTTPSLTTTAGAEIEIHRKTISSTNRMSLAVPAAAAVFIFALGGYGLYRKGVADGRSQASAAVSTMSPMSPMSPVSPVWRPAPTFAERDEPVPRLTSSPAPPSPAPGAPPPPVVTDAADAAPAPAAPTPRAVVVSPLSCNPPWIEDDAGLKRYKPGCMGL